MLTFHVVTWMAILNIRSIEADHNPINSVYIGHSCESLAVSCGLPNSNMAVHRFPVCVFGAHNCSILIPQVTVNAVIPLTKPVVHKLRCCLRDNLAVIYNRT